MKQTYWTYCTVFTFLVQIILITNSTPSPKQLISENHEHKLKLSNVELDVITHKTLSDVQIDKKKKKIQQQNNSLHAIEENVVVGQQTGRFMASYFFPIFPQFFDTDYGGVWNWLKRADTIGYFLFEELGDVSVIFYRQYWTGDRHVVLKVVKLLNTVSKFKTKLIPEEQIAFYHLVKHVNFVDVYLKKSKT